VLRFATWAGVMFGFLVADSVISAAVHTVVGPVGQGLVTYVGVTAFFWWTMYFLLAGRVPWRRLVRPAILTRYCGSALSCSLRFTFPPRSSRIAGYGTIGVVFSLMIWFIAIGAVVVPGAVAGATWDQHEGTSRSVRA
jgi:membrane protein